MNTNIQVIPTPGHAHEHASLLVKTDRGNVVIAGDLFWRREDEKQKTDYDSLIKKEDPYAKNKTMIKKSREKNLDFSDYVISGHGKPFKVSRNEG